MPTFLASLGIKDAFYGAIIATIFGVLAWFYHKGELHVRTQVAAAEAKQEVHVAKVETSAADQIVMEKSHEVQIENDPVTPVGRIRLCRSPARILPQTATADSGAAAPAVVGAVDPALAPALPDPTELVRIGRDDDAYIAGLEAEIATLRGEMK
jgi:hypothetical protein